MKTRKLGQDLTVSAIGLGCMGMSHAYGGQPEAQSIATIHRALDIGVTFFDTAEVYGPFENEKLVGKALKGRRDEAVIATKFGFRIRKDASGAAAMDGVDSRPEHVKAVCDESLQRLGLETIDLFYQHRVDPSVPIEETVGAVADLIQAGKVRALGLSEAGADTIRRAHAVHPVSAVQNEYSLWTRDPEAEIIPLCEALGITLVPYSPLGRGQLTGAITSRDQLAEGDFRRNLPRFQEEAIAANAALADTLKALGNARRLMLLCKLVEHGEVTVGDLAHDVGLSQSACSQHLARMRDEGLVAYRRESQTLWYSIADARVETLLATLYQLYCKD